MSSDPETGRIAICAGLDMPLPGAFETPPFEWPEATSSMPCMQVDGGASKMVLTRWFRMTNFLLFERGMAIFAVNRRGFDLLERTNQPAS
jgi:hypothetical protein